MLRRMTFKGDSNRAMLLLHRHRKLIMSSSKQTPKEDSLHWLTYIAVGAVVQQMVEYFRRVAESWAIDCHIFLHPHRLVQFEHYHHIWSEFRKVDHQYRNPYITFSDDDDLSHPDRLATFVASSYSPFVPTFCQLAHFTDKWEQAPARSVDEITNPHYMWGMEYVTSFCSLFLLNRYFTHQCHLDLQRDSRLTDLLFLSFIRSQNGDHILSNSYHYFARQNRFIERAW